MWVGGLEGGGGAHTHIHSINRRIYITFNVKDLVLKIFKNSRESVIFLNFEGILVFWLRGNLLKPFFLGMFDLKPTFC